VQPPLSRAKPQYLLNDLLNAEVLHSLGAYQLAWSRMQRLLDQIPEEEDPVMRTGIPRVIDERVIDGRSAGVDRHQAERRVVRGVLEVAITCNEHLRNELHNPERSAARGSSRHPSPCDRDPSPDVELLVDVYGFYDAAQKAMGAYLAEQRGAAGQDPSAIRLGKRLAWVHDPQMRAAGPGSPADGDLEGRIERMVQRREEALALHTKLSGSQFGGVESTVSIAGVLGDHTGDDRAGAALHLTILRALSEAHIHMHYAEHLRSQSFGVMMRKIPETDAKMRSSLAYSLVLNTFVYVAARTAPWVFAEDEHERDHVLHCHPQCCITLTPTLCMWVANQAGMLALNRRAYAHSILGDYEKAFYDFYKLIRLLRDLREHSSKRAGRPPGTRTLIEGLTAIAEHHIGELYRGEHAHRVALRHFDRAVAGVRGWEQHGEIAEIFNNSRWRINLLIGQGKANYELGRAKQSLYCYARAWRAFLLLAESEGHSLANLEVVLELLSWLESTEAEPNLRKTELSHRLRPLIEQFETVTGPNHLRLLAADIMMRMGHLIFMLKLPPLDWMEKADDRPLPPPADHLLARRCSLHAGTLDPASTLIAADLLKFRRGAGEGYRELHDSEEDPPMAQLQEQWPTGGGRFEEAARVIEYILQCLIETSSDEMQAGWGQIACELLGSFLAHTDSSNVKLAQVYRYLMKDARELASPPLAAAATIDVVCLRRYSSFFPFLPRPAAFRAPGGGYLAHVCEPGHRPFGIAVDPGPNFPDNLYRCGYSLADIQMIVITHDHADHLASLDALLALLGIRMALGDETFSRKEKCRLAIVGNESIVHRYSFYNDPHPVREDADGKEAPRRDAVKVMSFADMASATALTGDERAKKMEELELLVPPEGLRIEPVRTFDHDDAAGHISQGFLLTMAEADDRVSVLFTGDTGAEPPADEPGHYHSSGEKSLGEAAMLADVVVAHLSSVPLREMRELAGLTDVEDGRIQAFMEVWDVAAQQARAGDKETDFLLKQLQFGFRARSALKDQFAVSPLSPTTQIKGQPEKHLYLTGTLTLAERMASSNRTRPPLLLIGELREELGTFRTRIASRVTEHVFRRGLKSGDPESAAGAALTADIGLRVRLTMPGRRVPSAGMASRQPSPPAISVLCTTCDMDNDLIATERFHIPSRIREVCVKGENEGVFYNCPLHDPGRQADQPWLESVERFDVFRE
jgi:tetratricopeptide (TPR) repeat protein